MEIKTIKFEDVNEISETTEYIIEVKDKINPETQYFLESPFSYFRIPERTRIKINLELMQIQSKSLYEKIIWYYIFEVIYNPKDNNNEWKEYRANIKTKTERDDIENEIKNMQKETKKNFVSINYL